MTIHARNDLVGRTVRVSLKRERDYVRGKVVAADDEHLMLDVRGWPMKFLWAEVDNLLHIVNKEKK
jgi:hypothetical protein